MPGKIKVKILAGRNLPVMDRSGDTTDAYVEIKFGNTIYKTDVCRKSLNPQWNSEWYRFEVDDAVLQDEPLQVRLMDHDTYSSNDAIGKVYVNLNPLLLPGSPLAVKNIWTLEATMNSSSGSQGGSVMTGWIPVYDTMHGIRGEVNIIVKVELFSDCNKFRQSSCGVQFFYSPNVPHGYHAQVIHGFVEELVVSDDPEYKWIDKIRTPRASNEERQTLFFKLSGEVQRKIGLKALDFGGNAVIGYVQNFDLEGESGIVARGIGTAVTLVKLQDTTSFPSLEASNIDDLTCFASQTKNPLDYSGSDDSLPLLVNSSSHSPKPRSPINLRATTVGQRFPKTEKSSGHQRRATVRISEYRAAGLRGRQLSLQTGGSSPTAVRGIGSTLSLGDDLISESSLRNMLALEDMRGEPASNPFSRGLKNFRYLHQTILPKRVAQLRSKITDSFDDESDPDSNYSSSWSLAGSESNRSSIVDLRHSMRKKKFTHKKNSPNDSIAALLIRSVHTGFPLDSVKEDRETPAPSPVNFVDSDLEGDRPKDKSEPDKKAENNPGHKEVIDVDKLKVEIPKLGSEYAGDIPIPMISSSESDTSTSDDDDPSESSTNYNILDETYSLLDSNSPNERKYSRINFSRVITSNKIVEADQEDSSFRSQGERSLLESSTDYNILDETSSLKESKYIQETKTEKKIQEKYQSDVSEIETIERKRLLDYPLESSTDYNILDDTSMLQESRYLEDTKIEIEIQEKFEPDVSDVETMERKKLFDYPLESSTDYNILDDTSSLQEPKYLADVKIEKEIQEKFELDETKERKELFDYPLESSTDYNILDDTSLLQDSKYPEETQNDENFQNESELEGTETKTVENNSLLEKPMNSVPESENLSKIEENLSANLSQDPLENSGQNSIFSRKNYFLMDAPLIEKFPSCPVLKMKEENISETMKDAMLSSEIVSESLKECASWEKNSTEKESTLMEKNFDSSTDYNVLDDSSSLIETRSLKVENFNPIFQNTPEENLPKSAETREILSSTTIENFPMSMDNFSFDYQTEKNFDSSTDYNVLDEETRSIETPSLVDEKKSSPLSIQPETVGLIAELTLPPALEKMGKNSKNLETLVSSKRKSFAAPFSMPRQPSPEASSSDCPSPSNGKLKHLKFLPKQDKFDSEEDPDFVTSTPVEINETPPDFSPNFSPDKSPSVDSRKFCFDAIASISRSDSTRSEKRRSAERSSEKKVKQICPLGVPVDKVTIMSEQKIGSCQNLLKDSKSVAGSSPERRKDASSRDSIRRKDGSPRSSTSRKSQKRLERTDTVIYKGPAKEYRDKWSRKKSESLEKSRTKNQTPSPIPIIVASPAEEQTSRLQVPTVQTSVINVQSTFTPDEIRAQQTASRGARKSAMDELTLNERLNRKYRLHCMLDLLKTIDSRMMVHHGHHDRRDSTKSKQRRKREKISANATPSPDSIHRARSHRKRSRSRSPDRQHTHPRVSTLTTHSFPVKNSSSSNLSQETALGEIPSEHSPREVAKRETLCENTPKKEITLVTRLLIEEEIYNEELTFPKITLTEFDPGSTASQARVEETNLQMKTSNSILPLPKDLDHPVFKSHSADSLDCLGQRSSLITTNITNSSNTIDDLCVPCPQLTRRQQQEEQPSSPLPSSSVLPSSLGSKLTSKANVPNMHRRSSDSDLSITPKGNSLAGSDRSMGQLRTSTAIVRTMNQDTMEMLEYPFITMQHYPPGFILHIGGLVSARSVKLLERITNPEEPEGRDAWWTEIRMEVRSHARALACNVVLGYKEEISISDDVCVLNASGTAAVINLLNANQEQENVLLSRTIMTTSLESEKAQGKSTFAKGEKTEEVLTGQHTQSTGKLKRTSESNDHEIPYLPVLSACALCHLPYNETSVPFRVDVSKCSICKRAKVPDVLFTTIELPENIPMTGRGAFLQATVCKCKRDLRGELNAREISDCLPFLEYELHSLLLNKLKVKGMNAIFGLKVQVSVGERLVIGMAVGTAVYLTALPAPSVPQIASGNSWHNEEQLAEIQKTLIETVKKNREFYHLKPIVEVENGRSVTTSDTDESDEDLPDMDLGIGTKDACVLEVDDVEDMARINLLMDDRPPDDFHVVNTQSIPGLEDLEIVRNLQMFTQISRAKIPAGQFSSMPSKYFARMLQTIFFKLRRMVPCALCDMQFKIALPEQDEIQLSVVGMALGLGEPTKFNKFKRKPIPSSTSKDPIKKTTDEGDLIFSLDEDQVDPATLQQEINQMNTSATNSSPLIGLTTQKHRPRSPFRTKLHTLHRHKHVPLKERYGVDITPLSYLPGGKIERYLGNLNFFFIRESTSIRENGGLSGFTHSFVTEVLAIVRAHVTALGGNAMVAFFMTQCILFHSPHKNQGQCLINVGGDVVSVSYYGDEKYSGNQNC